MVFHFIFNMYEVYLLCHICIMELFKVFTENLKDSIIYWLHDLKRFSQMIIFYFFISKNKM